MVDSALWKKRISTAKARREKHERQWAGFALLHAKAYMVAQAENDDEGVTLPNGDQVLLSLVHRNIEQTLAVLESPEIGVRVTCMDTTRREENFSDTHRESIVEQALVNSLRTSGLLSRTEAADAAKRDAVIFGHGIVYSWYRVEETEVDGPQALSLEQGENGEYSPQLDDESGEPIYIREKEKKVLWEGVQDEHVSVLEFLFESTAKSIAKARWHGREEVVPLGEIKADSRYEIPADIDPLAYRLRDIYGEDANSNEVVDEDWVRKVTIWDKSSKKLLVFLDARLKGETNEKNDLLLIYEADWPVVFSHPDDSPFSIFVPIPANDQPFGVSQIMHIRNPGVEADKVESRLANVTRQQKRIFVYNKKEIDPSEIDKAIKTPDLGVVGIDMDEGKKLSDFLQELPPPPINPDLFRQSARAEATMRNTSGISDVPLGGAQTATESENITAVGSARANRKRRIMLDWFAEILGRHCDLLREFAPEGQSIMIQDEQGLPMRLDYGREAFQGRFDIKVLPSGGAFGMSPVQQKTMLELSGAVLGKFGPAFDRGFLGVVLKKFDVPNAQRLLALIPLQQAAPPMPQQPPPANVNLNDYTDAQALRAGVNSRNE